MNDTTARLWPLPSATTVFVFIVLLASLLLGPLVARNPLVAVAAVLATALAAAAFVHPPLAVYVIVLMPLVAGIDRGTALPLIRPAEAITILVGVAVVARLLLALANGDALLASPNTAETSILFLAVAGSLLPLLFLIARGEAPTQDDILYSVQVPKFVLVYVIVRASIRTKEQVGRCLRLAMAVGAVVAVLGIFQALDMLGIRQVLLTYFPPTDDALVGSSRASSTLAHPFAMADLMIFNVAIVGAWFVRMGYQRWLLTAGALFAVATLSSGQFSGALGLVVAVVVLGLLTGRVHKVVVALLPVAMIAGVVLRPVIDARLQGFKSPAGLPESWLGRIHNLQTYVWPRLAEGLNWVLGVRPSARVPIGNTPEPFVYIESGYTWLLWVGGVPLLVGFIVFLVTNLRAARRRAQQNDQIGVASTAAFVALSVVGVLTVLDPHLTLRGSGDLLFVLLALAHVANRRREQTTAPASTVRRNSLPRPRALPYPVPGG